MVSPSPEKVEQPLQTDGKNQYWIQMVPKHTKTDIGYPDIAQDEQHAQSNQQHGQRESDDSAHSHHPFFAWCQKNNEEFVYVFFYLFLV